MTQITFRFKDVIGICTLKLHQVTVLHHVMYAASHPPRTAASCAHTMQVLKAVAICPVASRFLLVARFATCANPTMMIQWQCTVQGYSTPYNSLVKLVTAVC